MPAEISTDVVPAQKRFEFFREGLQRLFDTRWESGGPIGKETFRGRFLSYQMGVLGLHEMTATPYWVGKDEGGDSDHVSICLQTEGEVLVDVAGEKYSFGQGSAYILNGNHPLRISVKAAANKYNKLTAITIPFKMIEKVFGCYNFRQPILIPTRGGVNAAFLDMFMTFWRHAPEVEAETEGRQSIVAEHMMNSLINSLGAVLYSLPNPQAVTCTNLDIQRNKIKSFVKANLHTDLNLDKIAKAVNLSPRYVHNLFSTEPVTLMKWVMHERLDRCRRDLGACSPSRSIKEIAYSWGFKGQVQFSHAFRKRFGMSPKEYRARHALPTRTPAEARGVLPFSHALLKGLVASKRNDQTDALYNRSSPDDNIEVDVPKGRIAKIGVALGGGVLLAETMIEYFNFPQILLI